jgi:hypothetical protein
LAILEGEHASGQIIPVRITDAMAYDLHGIPESDWSNLAKNNSTVISLDAEKGAH